MKCSSVQIYKGSIRGPSPSSGLDGWQQLLKLLVRAPWADACITHSVPSVIVVKRYEVAKKCIPSLRDDCLQLGCGGRSCKTQATDFPLREGTYLAVMPKDALESLGVSDVHCTSLQGVQGQQNTIDVQNLFASLLHLANHNVTTPAGRLSSVDLVLVGWEHHMNLLFTTHPVHLATA